MQYVLFYSMIGLFLNPFFKIGLAISYDRSSEGSSEKIKEALENDYEGFLNFSAGVCSITWLGLFGYATFSYIKAIYTLVVAYIKYYAALWEYKKMIRQARKIKKHYK